MKRREFIVVLSGAAAWPPIRARDPRCRPSGYLGSGTPELFADRLAAFRQGLAAARYEEGRNVRIEFRWAEGRNDRFPALAADFVRRQVAVIAAPGSTPAALAARRRPQPSLLSSRSVVIPSRSAWLPVSIGPAVT